MTSSSACASNIQVLTVSTQTKDAMTKLSLPDKPYFRIGEVARLLGVETHMVRYWEKEFPQFTPRRSPSGHRIFLAEDIELLWEIKSLLHEKGFTLAGAKKQMALAGNRCDPTPVDHKSQLVSELKSILKMLD